MKQKQTARVLSQRKIAPMIYDMWIESDLAGHAVPGQFVCIYPKDKSTLLPRPISVCEVKDDGTALRIVYRVVGRGTTEFSQYEKGDAIDVLGMLGNGFPIDKAAGKKVFLMGGGIGIPPMLQLAKALNAVTDRDMIQIILGYRDGKTFLKEDLEQYGKVYVASEDGQAGTKGNVMDAVRENGLDAEIIFACGPMPMLRAIKRYAESEKIQAYISLEERMACGVGACLGCVARTRETDHHSNVKNARICTDGPVFNAEEVDI